MSDSTTQERMRWYEAGATYVAVWCTAAGGGVSLLFGYALEFGLLNVSPGKAFLLGGAIVWLAMLCSMFVAVGLSSAAVQEQ